MTAQRQPTAGTNPASRAGLATGNDLGQRAASPASIPLAGWREIAVRVKDEFGRDHVTLSAAGVAFFAFTALVPLFAAALSIYGVVADPDDVEQLVNRLDGAAPAEVVDVLEQQLASVADGSAGALGLAAIAGILFALWSASAAVGHLMTAINIAYDEDPDSRPFWKRRLLAIALTFAAVVGIGTSAGLTTLAPVLSGDHERRRTSRSLHGPSSPSWSAPAWPRSTASPPTGATPDGGG